MHAALIGTTVTSREHRGAAGLQRTSPTDVPRGRTLQQRGKPLPQVSTKIQKQVWWFILRCIHNLCFFLPVTISDLEQNTLKNKL